MGFLSSLFGAPKKRIPVADCQGPGKFGLEVVGESNYQDALEEICGGRTEEGHDKIFDALLIPDDQNPHDKKAIRVEILGHVVGFLSRENARQFRLRMKEAGFHGHALKLKARIRGGWDRGDDHEGLFGVTVDLPTGE